MTRALSLPLSLVLLLVPVVLAACGGAAPPPAAPASTPAPASEEAPMAAPPPATAGAGSESESVQSTAPDQPGARAAARARARSDFDGARRELSVAGSDCATACRALASMERAATRLCELATADDGRDACDDAQAKLREAKDRVHATCGGCAAR